MHDDFAVLNGILEGRFSCRGYLDKQVKTETIKKIVSSASRVPTWCNAQPWQVLVTKGEETKTFSEVLSSAAENGPMAPDFEWPEQYAGAYLDRRRECGYQLYEAVGIQRDDRVRRSEQMMENFRFFGAPHVAIVTSEADLGPYGAMDCGGFIALFTLAAKAMGIATVVQASVTGYAPVIRKYFKIPDSRLIQTAITFGYEDPDHPANNFRTSRAPIGDVISFFG